MPTELFPGLLAGLLGLLVARIVRPAEWGLLWTITALVGLFVVRPGWLARLEGMRNPLGIAVLVVIAGAMAHLFGSGRKRSAWLFLISLGGAWATIPDTEAISVLLGVTAPLVLAMSPVGAVSTSRLGGLLVGVLVAAAVVMGGGGREAAMVGAAGAFAVLALPRSDRLLRHLVLVAFWARVAGRSASGIAALLLGVGFTLAVFAVESFWLSRRTAPERER